jgi:hypothetical protein
MKDAHSKRNLFFLCVEKLASEMLRPLNNPLRWFLLPKDNNAWLLAMHFPKSRRPTSDLQSYTKGNNGDESYGSIQQ